MMFTELFLYRHADTGRKVLHCLKLSNDHTQSPLDVSKQITHLQVTCIVAHVIGRKASEAFKTIRLLYSDPRAVILHESSSMWTHLSCQETGTLYKKQNIIIFIEDDE